MGSSPVFPIILKSINYVNNKIQIGIRKKYFNSCLHFSVKNLKYVKFLLQIGVIGSYSLINKKNGFFIKINFSYITNSITQAIIKFKLLSLKSKKFFFSNKALKLIKKRLGFSILVLSTKKGLQVVNEVLSENAGGLALLLIY